MRYLMIVIALILSPALKAEQVEAGYIKSDKLNIISNWSKPDEIPISDIYRHSLGIIFDIDNVQKIIINDLNVNNGKCEDIIVASREIFFLSLPKVDNNLRRINIRVNRPCSIDNKVKLELLVRTSNKKVYSNIITLKASYSNYINREYE